MIPVQFPITTVYGPCRKIILDDNMLYMPPAKAEASTVFDNSATVHQRLEYGSD
jgi:hypothetical protein